ncbi:MAG: hypothetical protein ACE5HQ_10440 [Gemmatimonadota bacterium]
MRLVTVARAGTGTPRRLDGVDLNGEHRRQFKRISETDSLNHMLYVDMKTFMVCLNPTYNDKMSMAS